MLTRRKFIAAAAATAGARGWRSRRAAGGRRADAVSVLCNKSARRRKTRWQKWAMLQSRGRQLPKKDTLYGKMRHCYSRRKPAFAFSLPHAHHHDERQSADMGF